jgi:1-acyl-sn-glycerol-3-phosphate acyltransferase
VNWVTRTKEAVWGLFAWLSFGLAVLFSLVVVLIVPSAERRQKLVTWASRMIFVLPGIDVQVRGMDNLPTDNCIVVANHASYLDGPLKFVERTDIKGSTRDARQIVKAALGGESLGFFPEGTFRQEPGIGRFRPGAFVAAIKGDMPVVPISIGGSRYMLPAGRFLPRRGPLTIDILPAISPGDPEFESSRGLAEASRQRILAVLGEPDLLADDEESEVPG